LLPSSGTVEKAKKHMSQEQKEKEKDLARLWLDQAVEETEPNPEPSGPPPPPKSYKGRGVAVGYPPPISSDDEYPDSRSRGDYVETTNQATHGLVLDAGDIDNAYLHGQTHIPRNEGCEACAPPRRCRHCGGRNHRAATCVYRPGYEPNPWLLTLPEVNRARGRWRSLLLRVERILKLAHLGNAVQVFVTHFVCDRYIADGETQTEVTVNEQGTQTEEARKSVFFFILGTACRLVACGITVTTQSVGKVLAIVLRTPRHRAQLFRFFIRHSSYLIPTAVVAYQNIPDWLEELLTRLFPPTE
jgi:hypothetical protein